MNTKNIPFELKHSNGMKPSSGGVEFHMGPQSSFGKLFIAITFLSYAASITFMGMVFNEILSDDFSDNKLLGYFISALLNIALLFYGFQYLSFFITVSLFLSIGTGLLYISTDNSLLIYSLPIIVASHLGNYFFDFVIGDKLIISLSSNKYKIYYHHKIIDEGEFTQQDIGILFIDARGEGVDTWQAVFLPANRHHMKYAFDQQIILRSHSNDGYEEITESMKKLFEHLGVTYESN